LVGTDAQEAPGHLHDGARHRADWPALQPSYERVRDDPTWAAGKTGTRFSSTSSIE
jgi:hypothetical protein